MTVTQNTHGPYDTVGNDYATSPPTGYRCNNVYDSGTTPLTLTGSQSGHTDFPSPALGSTT